MNDCIVQYDYTVHCYSAVYPLLCNGDNRHLQNITLDGQMFRQLQRITRKRQSEVRKPVA
jgi:hypothetical protein